MNKRFIFYADFLGTKNRYSTPALVLRSRQLLEQALSIHFVPILEKLDMFLYLFSDTLIVTCPKLTDLLGPISNLFNRFLDFQENDNDKQMNLWLRAALSYGEIIESSHLFNGNRIRSIPLLDTSLPNAYLLESIRPGSRIFIDPSIETSLFGEYEKFILKWQQITGTGRHIENTSEFLWPIKIECDVTRLIQKTLFLNKNWKELLKLKDWSKSEYQETLIHLDETLKLFVRTCSKFCTKTQKSEIFYSLLPTNETDFIEVQYEWGCWFQALKGLIDEPLHTDIEIENIKTRYSLIRKILKNNRYLDHFLGELDFPDYSSFKNNFHQIGLNDIRS